MPKAAVFKPLTNRSASSKDAKFTLPADGFVMLVPKGEAPNVLDDGSKDGKRIIQVVDDEALSAIMSKLLNRGGEMLMDNDHHSHEQDKTTDANGWQPLEADSLQNRDDGLYGDPRWSTAGLDKVEGGVLRYISPEFGTSTLQPISGNRYRVTELTGLALTNRPGFKRLQKPLTNRDADGGIEVNANTNTMHKAALAKHLGITESDIDKLDETTLNNRLSGIKDQAAKADTYSAELSTLKNREVEEFMTLHDKVIPKDEEVRKTVKATFIANRATAEAMVQAFSPAEDQLTTEQKARAEKKPLFNRETAKGPANADVLKNREIERAAKIKNRCTAICDERRRAGKPVNFDQAYRMAESENPAIA